VEFFLDDLVVFFREREIVKILNF